MTKISLVLEIEFFLSPLWGMGPRPVMGQENWDIVRKQAYRDSGYACGICITSGELEAHEVWEYDDINHIQKLVGIIALCPLCHMVKHFGLSEIRAEKGELDLQKVTQHFLRVNRCSATRMFWHVWTVRETFFRRSKFKDWTVDWGLYQDLIPE